MVFSPSRNGLQRLLDTCHQSSRDIDLSFNVKKSVNIVFRSVSDRNIVYPPVNLGGTDLPCHKSVKYLGHILSDDLSDDLDMAREVRSMYRRINALKRQFHKCSVDVKRTLFLAFCTQFYSSSLWIRYRQASYNKIRVTYNNCIRLMFNLPRMVSISEACVWLNIPSFCTILRRSYSSILERLGSEENECMSVFMCNSTDVMHTSRFAKFGIDKQYT